MMNLLNSDRLSLKISLVLFFISLAGFVYTGSAYVLFAPFAWLYGILVIHNWKAAYWLLLFSLPLSVKLILANNTLSVTVPDQPLMWLFLFIGIMLLAYRPDSIPKWWLAHPVTIIILLQLIWLLVAVAESTVLFYSVKFLLAKTWFLVCFFIFPLWIFRTKKDFKTGFLILLVPILLTIVVIMIRHAFMGFRFSSVNASIGWLYYNHVEYSTVISMFFPLVYVAFLLAHKKNKRLSQILLITLLLFLAAIFLSYARAAMLGIVFAFIVALFIRYKLVNLIMPAVYAIIVFILIYMIRNDKYLEYRPDYTHTYMHSEFSDHIEATFKGRDMSSMERLYRWIAAIRMSRDKPISGYGPHGFYYHYKPYALPSFRTYASINEERSTTHNYFLYTLVEQGWPAMLLYAALIIIVFAQAQNIYHRFKDPFYKYCTLGLAMMFAVCFVNNFFSELIETHKVGALFYLILSLLIILDRKSKEDVVDIRY